MTRLDDYIAGLLSEDMAWEGDAEQAEQLQRCRRELVEVLGFTREDLALLELAADSLAYTTSGSSGDVARKCRSVADRIKALLPPEPS